MSLPLLNAKKQYFNQQGNPLVGGQVHFYQPGTLTPVNTFQDQGLTILNANPVVLDANGQCIAWIADGTSVREIVFDAFSNQIWDQVTAVGNGSNFSGPTGSSNVGFIQAGAGATARTSQAKMREAFTVQDFGAIGDNVTDDTSAFVAATGFSRSVYVPYTSTGYAVTALTTAQRQLLWGPGEVNVAGVAVPISSEPVFTVNNSPTLKSYKATWAPPTWPGTSGSLHNGAADFDITRTGGAGTYGSMLSSLLVTAAVPGGVFDVSVTGWTTATNITGGQSFGSWFGANSPAKNAGETWSSGAIVGMEVNAGNRWADLGLQTDLGSQYTTGIQVVPDVLPTSDSLNTIAVTSITAASPAVVTIPSHNFAAWSGIVFSGAGTLPTGLTAGVIYYVSATGITTNTFQVSPSVGTASINTTGSFAAPIVALPSFAGSFGIVISNSVGGHRWWLGTLTRFDTIMGGGYTHYDSGGSLIDTAPAAWTKLTGFYGRGLDVRGVAFTNYAIDMQTASWGTSAINFDFANSNATTATAGSTASPGNFQGFLKVSISGVIAKIPYFQN